jgi:lysophospholipase L1-like esterase
MINYLKFKKYFRMEPISCSTWASTQALLAKECNPPIDLSNNSLRQIFKISIGGKRFRIKITNKYGNDSLEIKSISIASINSQGAGQIELNTLKKITFGNNGSISISKGEEINTDIIDYHLPSSSEVAISIHFGETPENLTGHPGSKTYSFIEEGNQVFEKTFSSENKIAHWYIISAIEVSSNPRKKTIVCFGDSITDGTGSTNDKQNRWPDLLSTKLHLNKETSDIAVVNKGIGGNRITTQGLERFSYDVLKVKGVSHIIVLYGVNDINHLNATSAEIISAYKNIISQAHKNNIFIYAGTILPYGKHGSWTDKREKNRQEANAWIRNTKKEDGGFDGFFDFDELIRDPENPHAMYSAYDCGDGLHPSPEGYQQLVQAIDNLEIFNQVPDSDDQNIEEIDLSFQKGVKFELGFTLEKGETISVNIKGTSEGSYGFRVLTANEEGTKTSDYYYTGKIEKCEFQITNLKIEVQEDSNYIIIRRPISTININNIILKYLEVATEDKSKVFEMKEGSLLK